MRDFKDLYEHELDAHNRTKDELDRVRMELHMAKNRIAYLEDARPENRHPAIIMVPDVVVPDEEYD